MPRGTRWRLLAEQRAVLLRTRCRRRIACQAGEDVRRFAAIGHRAHCRSWSRPQRRQIAEAIKLYEDGHSLRAIATRLRVSRTIIWNQFHANGVVIGN
ncbi:helix-turn-helix domain-containing protein [Flexivirga aerilata]|uniref:helix-turn-helix domain-containing protein n=1 Tax=Flexivirga aerilata TaxID=1656889 RepID=UPI003CCDF9D5